MTESELQREIIIKASEDAEFRARLLADPRDAIRTMEGGRAIPDALTIHVHEESATSFHLVLPRSGKLTEAELMAVSAGGTPHPDWAFYGGG